MSIPLEQPEHLTGIGPHRCVHHLGRHVRGRLIRRHPLALLSWSSKSLARGDAGRNSMCAADGASSVDVVAKPSARSQDGRVIVADSG
jgi:hypothetical protein